MSWLLQGERDRGADEAESVFLDAGGLSQCRRGHTPVVRVSGRGSARISVAGLACMKAGQPGRFFYRMQDHRLRPGTRRAMSEADYATLIAAAHRYLNAPVIVIWDNLNTHLSRKMQAFTAGHPD